MYWVINCESAGRFVSYIPTQSDIEQTLNIINGRVVWAIPSVGCVMLIHHEAQNWTTYMKSNPTDEETVNYEKVETNLNVLGYQEASAKIIGEANNANDVLVVLREVVSKAKQQTELDDFWNAVDRSINSILDSLGI